MCKIKQAQYYQCKKCAEDMKDLLKNNDPATVYDRLLTKYDKIIIKLVLTATVKTNSIVKGTIDENTIKIMKPYYDTVGFLADSIKVSPASKFMVEALCELLRRNK